jgi:hypothetical protein
MRQLLIVVAGLLVAAGGAVGAQWALDAGWISLGVQQLVFLGSIIAGSIIGSIAFAGGSDEAASRTMLAGFRAYLIVWAGAILAHFTYVQSKTNWGATTPDWDPSNLWHPFYFGVVNATAVVIPFIVFQAPIARRFGGWSSSIGRALLAFGIGTVLWGFGNFFWFFKNVDGTDAPYPSWADAGYLAVLPFAAWALIELSRVVGITRRDWMLLPVALLFAFPLNAWIMLPPSNLEARIDNDTLARMVGWLPDTIGAGTFDTPLTTAISTTYILSDVVLLGMAIIIAIGARRAAGGRFFAPVLAYAVSILLLYVGDLFFNYRIANDTFYNAEISDLLYGAFIVSSSVAAYLFLRADVRAGEAIAAADDDWEPEQELGAHSDGPALSPLDDLATAILRGQERVMGAQTAHGIAAGIGGIEVDAQARTASAVDVVAIDALVREFRSIAGPLGEMACWTAARGVFTRHPDLHVPSLERFRTDAPTAAAGAGPARRPVGTAGS